jgi:hypothetical protein
MHDGTVIDARIATADLTLVQDLAEANSTLLARLYRQVHDGGQPDIDLVHELDEVFFVDGKLRPLTRLLLKNAIEAIGHSMYRMIDPFVDDTHNREVLANLEERRSIFLEKLSRELYDG